MRRPSFLVLAALGVSAALAAQLLTDRAVGPTFGGLVPTLATGTSA